MGKSYTLDELIDIAVKDQTTDLFRPWNFTSNCPNCGGVAAFIKWLKQQEENDNGD